VGVSVTRRPTVAAVIVAEAVRVKTQDLETPGFR
jgi:hypothetical protein